MTNTVRNVPAHIAARIAARKQEGATSSIMSAVVGGEGSPFPRVSIRAGRYRLVEDGVETVVGINLDTVIVGVNPHTSKVFYGKPYDPSATDMRPDCFSNDGIRPDPSVTAPVHTNCATCPNNVLGSKVTPTGAKSKLCNDQRHLALVPAADPSKVYAFTVPVSGMKGLRDYFKDLNNYGEDVTEVVTKLGFDETVSYPKITFTKAGYVSEKALAKVDAIKETEEVKEVTRELPYSGKRAALAAPAAAAALAAPAVDEPAEAPAPKATKDKPAPAAEPTPAVDDAYEEEGGADVGAANVSAIESALDGMFE